MTTNVNQKAAEFVAAARNASIEASAAAEYMEPALADLVTTLTGIAVESTEAAARAAGIDVSESLYWASGSGEWRVYPAPVAVIPFPSN